MRTRTVFPVLLLTALALAVNCGGTQAPQEADVAERCLPDEFPSLRLTRDGDIASFAGDSLFIYINGAAEMYHKYGFEEVHVGRYVREGGEIKAMSQGK